MKGVEDSNLQTYLEELFTAGISSNKGKGIDVKILSAIRLGCRRARKSNLTRDILVMFSDWNTKLAVLNTIWEGPKLRVRILKYMQIYSQSQ